MSKKKNKPELVFEDEEPCGVSRCGKPRTRKPCRFCGRIRAQGRSEIQIRKGVVHLERLTPIYIEEYADLSEDERKEHTLRIYLPPGTDITEYE